MYLFVAQGLASGSFHKYGDARIDPKILQIFLWGPQKKTLVSGHPHVGCQLHLASRWVLWALNDQAELMPCKRGV